MPGELLLGGKIPLDTAEEVLRAVGTLSSSTATRSWKPCAGCAARRHLPELGLAAPCGFGRVPERPGRFLSAEGSEGPPDFVPIILEDHLDAVEALRDVVAD